MKCQHVGPSPGQSMCECEHRRIELELLVAALAQEVLTLQNRLDRREPRVISVGRDPE